MRCPHCGADSPAGMKFCGRCGAPLPAVCGACGASNPAEHKFCGRCGALLDAPGLQEPAVPWIPAGARGLPGEIKQVTVLFCDIVNSTALTERIGAEAMRDLVGAFIDASLAEVHRYEGTAPQFSGDGFMALFGAPLTQEDHVRRALLAALAIRRAVSGEGAEAGGYRGLDLQIRIGIHTGPVVFGAIGGSFRMETVIGDTANLAARIQQAADPGTILVSGTVRALAQGYARVAPVGPLVVKGKSEPVSAYRLLGVARWRSARDAVPPVRTTGFVGRDHELASLEHFLPQVEDGRGQVVGIVGEPGIGKSRLLAEFRRRAGAGRVIWVEGRCLSYGAAIPYSLALDLLRSHCGIVETDTAETIAQKVAAVLRAADMDAEEDSPVLLHLLGIKNGTPMPAFSNPEAVKAKSFEVLQRLCLEGSRRRPLVLALEDLHWIDTISEELLGALAQQVGDARILLLAAYRPEYRPPWAGNLGTAEIPLQPLSRDDSLHVVRSVLQGERIAEPLTEKIVARADGNPLFLEQLALHAGETGDGRAEVTVPQTIHGVVMARIDRLPEATKQLLQTAAVIGREFSLRLLRAVWHGRVPLETQLRELSRLEFLDEWPDDEGTTYVFRHALTQEAAYGSLLERDRRSRHGDIGHALEQIYRDRTDEVAELLALHFARSHDAEKAVDYAIAAGEKSQRRWANTQALSYFDDALRLLDQGTDTEANRLRRIDAVLKQGELKLALGRHAEHLGTLEQIRNVVDQTDDSHRRAAWHYWGGFLQILTGGSAATAIGHCQKAAEIASVAGFGELDGFIASCLAQSYIVAGELGAAMEAGERALSIFEADKNLWWASRALWHLSSGANCLGEWEASLSYCRRALEYGTLLDDLRLKVAGLWRTGCAYVQQGDTDQGLRYCEDALALSPIPFDVAAARMVRGYGRIKAGEHEAGIRELSDVVSLFETSRLYHLRLLASLWLIEGYLAVREPIKPHLLADEVLRFTQNSGYLHFEGVAHRLTSECFAAEDPGAAEYHIALAVQILARVGARNDFAKALMAQAKLRCTDEGAGAAKPLLMQALSIFKALGTRGEPAKVEAMLRQLDRASPDTSGHSTSAGFSPANGTRPGTLS
jgi:class 3 adenylate cyclase/tetratricopeptide (TPR) repeat protein